MAEHERFQIHPDAVRAAADVIEALPNIGLKPSLVHIEEAGFSEVGQHFIVNIDAVQPDHEPAEHPEALQRKLNQIDDSTTDHAAEVAVAAPEAPMYPDVSRGTGASILGSGSTDQDHRNGWVATR